MAETSLSKQDKLRWATLLVAATIVVYANGMRGAFTYDDKAVIRDNPRIRTPRAVAEIFRTPYFGGPRGSGSAYRPALLLSYALQWWIHGPHVVAFHAGNIVVHAAATLLLALLLLRIGLSPPVCLATALLFAVHPIHVEAVTSLVGRGETLAAVFVLAYLILALQVLEGRRRRALSFAAALVFYALAVLTKESGAVAPLLLFLLFLFLSDGTLMRRLGVAFVRGLPLYVGSAVALGGVLLLRAWVLGGPLRSPSSGIFEVENALAPLPFARRGANACVILWRYVGRCLFPLHLSADESAWSIPVLAARSPLSITAMLLLGCTGLLALRQLWPKDPIALGFLFFGVALLPAGNFLFPTGTIFAERIAYLPSAGLCLILAVLFLDRTVALGGVSRWRLAAMGALVLVFASRAVVRNTVWWSDESLFANSLATSPRSAKAEYNFAYILSEKHAFAVARVHYARAIEIYRDYWDAWAGKGRVEKELGIFGEAERSYEESIRANAGYENGYFGLGQVREARDRPKEALDAYRKGLTHNPKSLPLAYHLALVSGTLGLSTARDDWKRAMALGGNSAEVRTEYAAWLRDRGEDREAVRQAREALRRHPAYLPAIRLLAERGAQDGLTLARALALEKAFHLSRAAADFEELEKIAQKDPAYGKRFTSLKRSGAFLPPVSRPPVTAVARP